MIGDFEVTTQKLPTLRGSSLRFKVNRLFSKEKGTVGDLTAEVLTAMLAQLEDNEVQTLILESLVCTSIITNDDRGQKIKYDLTKLSTIDQVFDGDVDLMWETVMFAWEVNFSRPTKGAAVVLPDPAP